MTTKNFKLGAVLTITTDKLLCDIGDVYEILNHMTGDTLFTHQLPRAVRECAPFLLRQFPQLPHGTDQEITRENWRQWLDAQIALHGDSFDIAPIPPAQHERIDPITEAVEIMGAKKVIAMEIVK